MPCVACSPSCRATRAAFLALAIPVAVLAAPVKVEVIGSHYRPDQPFPEFNAFWNEGSIQPDEESAADQADYVQAPAVKKAKPNSASQPAGQAAPSPKQPSDALPAKTPLGGSLHLFLRNTGTTVAKVEDALLGGRSLNKCLAFSNQRKVKKFASIYFANLPKEQLAALIDNGEPVWWKVDPLEIAPGGVAEVIVRLRSRPKPSAVPVAVTLAGATVGTQVPVKDPAPRLEGIYFGPDLQTVYIYARHPDGAAPVRLTLDGKDITPVCRIPHDKAVSVTPVVARLNEPLAAASFHVFGAAYPDGTTVMSGLRAWSDEFVYGVFGGKPGPDKDLSVGKAYVDDLVAHNMNLQMPQIGSGAVLTYFKSPEGHRHIESAGLRFVLPDPGKFGIDKPYALYVHDEPDCGDYKAEGLPDSKKIGVLARWCISRADELRAAAPDVMQMLNVNMTYKPHNWHVYGQFPDIFCVDPYYQVRLKDVYHKTPERRPLYDKATYIYMVSSLAQSAAAPNPVHVILYGNQQRGRPERPQTFRFPTAPEKRIEAYYALAGGAKSLSYWWYTPGGPAHGLGAATSGKPDAAAQKLWREIGLIGAEARTAGPVLTTSCPVDVTAKASDGVWVRFLARGDDTLVMLAVNDQYRNTDKGTEIRPVTNATVNVDLPKWIQRPEVFEITPAGVESIAARSSTSGLRVPLGKLDVTRMVVITSNATLRGELQNLYEERFAAATARLLN